jgi:hypothetical protein
MSDRKEVPIGIILFLSFIIVFDAVFFFSLGNTLMAMNGDLATFLTFSQDNILMWIDVLFAILSLMVIPYGFLKRKKSARFFALVFLSYSTLRLLLFISMTGEKNIGFLLFALCVIALLYLFTTSVKNYFGTVTMAIVPVETAKGYTYGLYTLYTELVHLKNGKNQIIYFFSIRKPKSGTPTALPKGYLVEVSKRSGLPYLKKDPSTFPTAS